MDSSPSKQDSLHAFQTEWPGREQAAEEKFHKADGYDSVAQTLHREAVAFLYPCARELPELENCIGHALDAEVFADMFGACSLNRSIDAASTVTQWNFQTFVQCGSVAVWCCFARQGLASVPPSWIPNLEDFSGAVWH